MQVGTNLSHYQNNSRVTTIDKTVAVSEPIAETARYQSPLNPSFSRTVLSHNLANVLWEVGGGNTQQSGYIPPRSNNGARDDAQMNWVRNAYAEHE
jgi:hypothetical protein